MGFWDSLGRSVTNATGITNTKADDAMKAAQAASAKQAKLADAERKKIADQEKIEKDKINAKQMRGLKRKFGGSGMMSGSDDKNTTLGA